MKRRETVEAISDRTQLYASVVMVSFLQQHSSWMYFLQVKITLIKLHKAALIF